VVSEPTPEPEFFVARDRARRFYRRIGDVLKERRLAYRGADIGMATVSDRAREDMNAIVQEIGQSLVELDEGRIRDRERGYMEVPLQAALASAQWRMDAAQALEGARRSRMLPEAQAREAVLDLLADALRRLDAFCAAYDGKQPVGPSSVVDLEHVLERVERLHGYSRRLLHPELEPVPPFDRPPPPMRTDGVIVEDLLGAARLLAPPRAGPWRVEPAAPGRPLRLTIGTPEEDAASVEVPPALQRLRSILKHIHPVEITCTGRATVKVEAGLLSEPAEEEDGAAIDRVELLLADDAAAGLETVVEACAGRDAQLSPDAEKVVRTLMAATDLPESGPLPPDRLVPLMGLLRTVDTELTRVLSSRTTTSHCQVTASQVPRESTRKAPVKRDFADRLAAEFTDFPVQRLSDVANAAASGKLTAKHYAPWDAAVLLALLGRAWRHGGRDVDRSMALEPLTEADVNELIADLCDFQAVRRELESGAEVPIEHITRMERAGIGVLGRLGRLA